MRILEIIPPRRFACVLAAVMLTVPAAPSAIADQTRGGPSADVLALERLHSEVAHLEQRVGQLEAKLAGDRADDGMVIGLTRITPKEDSLGEDEDWAERYWRELAEDGH